MCLWVSICVSISQKFQQINIILRDPPLWPSEEMIIVWQQEADVPCRSAWRFARWNLLWAKVVYSKQQRIPVTGEWSLPDVKALRMHAMCKIYEESKPSLM